MVARVPPLAWESEPQVPTTPGTASVPGLLE